MLKGFYGQREIEFPSVQIVLSDRRQNPLFYTSHLISEQVANPIMLP